MARDPVFPGSRVPKMARDPVFPGSRVLSMAQNQLKNIRAILGNLNEKI